MASAGQKIAATVAIIAGFLLMNQCDTDSTHNQPSVSTTSSDDVLAYENMQASWDVQTLDTQYNLCSAWWEDEDMSVDLFYAMAAKNGMDPVPSEWVVRDFFNTQCN